MEVSLPGAPATRTGSGGRRKLGSRHGWGMGLSRGGSGVSQSFSPGDHKTRHQRSSQSSSSVLWEGERRASQEADAPVSGREAAEEDEVKGEEGTMRKICVNVLKISILTSLPAFPLRRKSVNE